jgi:chromosome partitioning protein
MATVISFINFKGGVGKTTLCVEIAAMLAHKFNERVLIVDLDPQTNATLSLMTEDAWKNHADSKGTLSNFFDACFNERHFDLKDILIKRPVRRINHLDVLPSHIELFGMDLKLATKFGHNDIQAKLFLRKALADMEDEYDYVFIDCPPNLYLATQNGLFSSNLYVIVALAEYLSTLGIAHIQRSISSVFSGANDLLLSLVQGKNRFASPKLLGILFNRVRYISRGTSNENGIMSQIRGIYPSIVFDNFVPQSTQIADRPAIKEPIAVSGYSSDVRYVEKLQSVAEEFYERVTRPE